MTIHFPCNPSASGVRCEHRNSLMRRCFSRLNETSFLCGHLLCVSLEFFTRLQCVRIFPSCSYSISVAELSSLVIAAPLATAWKAQTEFQGRLALLSSQGILGITTSCRVVISHDRDWLDASWWNCYLVKFPGQIWSLQDKWKRSDGKPLIIFRSYFEHTVKKGRGRGGAHRVFVAIE